MEEKAPQKQTCRHVYLALQSKFRGFADLNSADKFGCFLEIFTAEYYFSGAFRGCGYACGWLTKFNSSGEHFSEKNNLES